MNQSQNFKETICKAVGHNPISGHPGICDRCFKVDEIQIIKAIAEFSKIDLLITKDSRLKDLKVDGIDFLEIVMALEESLDIEIPDEAFGIVLDGDVVPDLSVQDIANRLNNLVDSWRISQ